MEFPRIVSCKATVLSPWVTVLEKDVCMRENGPRQVYHSITQAAYVSIFAMTRDGQIPIVKQYRPAVEAYTCEFPAGTVDQGETPRSAAARELLEETGLHAEGLAEIGAYYPDTGRMSMASSGFFAVCGQQIPAHPPEHGIEVRYVSLETLFEMIRSGEFRHQLHVGLVASALVHGHITLRTDARFFQ